MRVIVVSSQPALALALSTQVPNCEARSATSAASAADIASPDSLILLDIGATSQTEAWVQEFRSAGIENAFVVLDAPEAQTDGPVVHLSRPFSLSDLVGAFVRAQDLARELASTVVLAASVEAEVGSPPAELTSEGIELPTEAVSDSGLADEPPEPGRATPVEHPAPEAEPPASSSVPDAEPGAPIEEDPFVSPKTSQEVASNANGPPTLAADTDDASAEWEGPRAGGPDGEVLLLRIRPDGASLAPMDQPDVIPVPATTEEPRKRILDEPVTAAAGAHGALGSDSMLPRLVRRFSRTATARTGSSRTPTNQEEAVHARVSSALGAAMQLESVLADLWMLQSVAECGALLLQQVASVIDVGASAIALRGRAGDLEIVAASGQLRGASDGHVPLDHPFVRAVKGGSGALLLSPTDAARGMLAGVPLSAWPVLLAAAVQGDEEIDGLVLVGRDEPADPRDLDRLYTIVEDGSDIVRLAGIIRRLPRPEGVQMEYLHSWMR